VGAGLHAEAAVLALLFIDDGRGVFLLRERVVGADFRGGAGAVLRAELFVDCRWHGIVPSAGAPGTPLGRQWYTARRGRQGDDTATALTAKYAKDAKYGQLRANGKVI